MAETPDNTAAEFLCALIGDSIDNAVVQQDFERVGELFRIQVAMAAGERLTVAQMRLFRTVALEAIAALEQDPAFGAGVAMLRKVAQVATERLDAYEKGTTDA